MAPGKADEKRLLAARRGDQEATQQIWAENRSWLFAWIRARISDQDAARDLLQETALRLVQGIQSLRNSGALRAWLKTVALNLVISYERRRKHERINTAQGPVELSVESKTRPGDLDDLARAMASMAPEYREPLLLKTVRGMTHEEVAEIVGISPEALTTRLYRARRMLREKLERRKEQCKNLA